MIHQMALMHNFKTSFKIVQNLKRLMVTYILVAKTAITGLKFLTLSLI